MKACEMWMRAEFKPVSCLFYVPEGVLKVGQCFNSTVVFTIISSLISMRDSDWLMRDPVYALWCRVLGLPIRLADTSREK